MKFHLSISILLFTACVPAAPMSGLPERQGDIVGIASVIDGDTLEIHGQRVRLFGMDAPESRQSCTAPDGRPWRCGAEAAKALADRIARRPVECEERDIDRYGRVVASCVVGREDLGTWMVGQGWAVAYRQYSTIYVRDEDAARSSRRGIWAGTFEAPSEWRKSQRDGAVENQSTPGPTATRLLQFAASYSCSPRKYCTQMSSCAEARWALQNCSWGSALDRDGDGVPCETICSAG